MSEEKIKAIKKDIIAIGRLLWESGLASGLNGNISARIDDGKFLVTANKTCLGLLQEKDILLVDLDGAVLGPGTVSTEKLMHTEIYRHFDEGRAVIHTHTVFTNAYFLENDSFCPRTFEAKFLLGEVKAIRQNTPNVTDTQPVLAALKENNIVVLKQHGAVAMGKELFDSFLLIQGLEEAIKVDAISRLYWQEGTRFSAAAQTPVSRTEQQKEKKYKLFSPEQMEVIVGLVNADQQLQELGQKTKMTMDLAVKLDETGQIYSFKFVNGRISAVGHDQNAEFLISAPENVWRAVFNRQIDPFVATTQKKMHLRGDFARIAQWYEPCCRIFEIWRQVPVES